MESLVTLTRGAPAATLLLATIIGASLLTLYAAPSLIERCLFRPHWLLRRREYPTLITSAFVHADLPHLLFNAFTFWAFAFGLERAMGTPGFVALYGVGLLASAAGTWFKHRHEPGYRTLGASGAIFGLLGVILRQPDPLGAPIPLLSRAMGEAFWTFGKLHLPLILLFAIPMLLGGGFGLAWEAHLGGFIAGLLLGAPVSRWCGDGSEWEFLDGPRAD